jgi:membrane protein YqaA with SNARE-associated domain
MSSELGLAALFASAFLSATLLPGNSEAALLALLALRPELATAAIALATLGNTLGGATTYLLGRLIPRAPSGRAVEWLRRFGTPALLMSWAPVVGDALCAAAGWLRLPWLPALLFMAAGKFLRYAAIAGGLELLRRGTAS